jgi:hypothetical protein
MKNKNAVIGWVALVLVVGGLLVWSAKLQTPTAETMPITIADPTGLPGLQEGKAPWVFSVEGVAERMKADNLEQLSAEGQVLHIHQHLDIFVNGKLVAVPANIGVGQRWISPIHTHDASQIIHVESPIVATFTLGQFFDVWGVKLTETTLGGYTVDETRHLTVYVNGEKYIGDPRMLELGERQQITITYGTNAETPATIPSSYQFPEGY